MSAMTKTHYVASLVLLLAGTARAQTPPPLMPQEPAEPAPAPPQPTPPPAPAPAPAPPPAIEPAPAPVAVAATVEEPAAKAGVLASLKIGGIVPFNGLSPFVAFGVEVGYALPALDHRLAIVLDVDYTQPTKTGTEMDTRVTGGTYTWKLTEQELAIMPAVIYRLTDMSPVVPYGGIGPRILFARSSVRDNGAPAIMETREQSTRVGIGVPLGVELAAGPGRAIGELLLQYGTLDHTATGDANTGAATLNLGYRMVF